MKYKIVTLSILVSFIIILSGCSPQKKSEDKLKEVEGTILVVGNEPFTNLAIQVEPDSICVLSCSDSLESELLNNQGRNVKVYYDKVDSTNGNKKLSVVKFEFR